MTALRDPWLVGILLLAAGLRLYAIDHGLPFVYNPDEANIMARSLALARDPNPHYFLYPSFFFYLVAGTVGLLYLGGRLLGRYPDRNAFEALFFSDPTDFYLAGRLVGVVAALGTVWLCYHVVSRRFGRSVGRAAAFFIAVAYFHVRDAHYLKHDVPAGFFVLLSIAAFDRIMEVRTLRSYAWAGAALGTAFATHYYTVFLAPALVGCHLAAQGLRSLRNLVTAAAVSGLTFFALSPFVVLDFPTAIEHMKANRQVVVDRSLSGGVSIFPSLGSYMRFIADQGLGYVLLALVVVGVVLLARRGLRHVSVWVVFPAVFLCFVSYTFFAGRYLNPIVASLALAAALAVEGARSRWGSSAAVTLAVVASLQPLYYGFQVNRLFAGDDTRTLARGWALAQLPAGEAVALQSYSVPLPQSAASVEESLTANGALGELDQKGKFFYLRALGKSTEKTYRLYFVGEGDEKNRIYHSYRELNRSDLGAVGARGVAQVVLRYSPETPPSDVLEFFARVKRQGRLSARFSPFRSGASSQIRPYLDNEDWKPTSALAHKGPLVEIWTLEKR